MSSTRRLAVVAACALAAVVALETLRWLRPIGHVLARGAAPIVRVATDGAVVLEETRRRRISDGSVWAEERALFDREGRLIALRPGPMESADDAEPSVREGVAASTANPWVRAGRLDSRCRDDSAVAATLRSLNKAEGWDYGVTVDEVRAAQRSKRFLKIKRRQPWIWGFEDGRFVCRDVTSADVVAGFGPDGYVGGSGGASGERFAAGLVWAFGPRDSDVTCVVLVDPPARRAYFVRSWPHSLGAVGGASRAPPSGRVLTVDLAGAGGEQPTLALDAQDAWRTYVAGGYKTVAVPLRVGRELLVATEDGVSQRVRLDDDEHDLVPLVDFACIATTRSPVGSPVGRVRVRRLLDDGKVVTEDVDAIPVTTWGRVAVMLDGVPSLLRPPLLNAASFAGPRVADYDDFYSRWLTDGVVAGGDGTVWFVGSLGVGALCAWLVRRQALRRCPNRAALWTTLGAAGGPVALVWMRIAMPKSHVVACACGRRRAVHVATCPSCSADWPTPQPTGIEVFAAAT